MPENRLAVVRDDGNIVVIEYIPVPVEEPTTATGERHVNETGDTQAQQVREHKKTGRCVCLKSCGQGTWSTICSWWNLIYSGFENCLETLPPYVGKVLVFVAVVLIFHRYHISVPIETSGK